MKKLLLACVLLMSTLMFGTNSQCNTGTLNGVTTVCGVLFSTHGLALNNERTLNYDVNYPTAAGPNNNLPIIIFMHYGGYRQAVGKENHGEQVFAALVLAGYNVYVPEYTLTAMGILNHAAPAKSTSVTVIQDGGNYFPHIPMAGDYGIRIANESMTIQSQTLDTGNEFYLFPTVPTVSAHAKGAFTYIPETEWPRPGNDGARFLAFLGHNAGQRNGIPGNPHDIRLWGLSAGAHLALELAMNGLALFPNDGEFSLADFNNAKITKVVASSAPADEGCVGVIVKDGSEPNTVASLIGGIPTATTVSTTDCAETGANSYYLTAKRGSPVSLASATSPTVPTLLQTGALDVNVTPAPAKEFMELTVGNPHVTQTTYPTFGHLLDIYLLNGCNTCGLYMNPQSIAIQAMMGFIE